MTNPFLPRQETPAYAPPAPAPAGNPYAQPPAPVGNPYAQPAAAPAPQYQGWPQNSAPAPTNLVAQPGKFNNPPPPSASGGGARPRLLDMYGRLLIILPEHIQRGLPSRFMNNGQPQLQDKLTATVIVLDSGDPNNGPKLAFGGEPEKGPAGKGPHTQFVDVPYVVKGLWINQSKLIEQLEESLAQRLRGEPGLALGRLWKVGSAQNDPWVLAPAQPADVALYDRYVSQVNPFSL